jgi:hypothetical protein
LEIETKLKEEPAMEITAPVKNEPEVKPQIKIQPQKKEPRKAVQLELPLEK